MALPLNCNINLLRSILKYTDCYEYAERELHVQISRGLVTRALSN